MSKYVHRVLQFDQDAGRLECASCGWVPASIKDGRPKCSVARRLQRGRVPKPHGLTKEEAREFRVGKRCALCGGSPEVVDHDHASGEIRDVLCRTCNWGLGNFKDDPDLMRKAAIYVELHRGRAFACSDEAVTSN